MKTKDHVIHAIEALIRIDYDNEKQTRHNIIAAVDILQNAMSQPHPYETDENIGSETK